MDNQDMAIVATLVLLCLSVPAMAVIVVLAPFFIGLMERWQQPYSNLATKLYDKGRGDGR